MIASATTTRQSSNEARLLLAAGVAVVATATRMILQRRRYTSQIQVEQRRAYEASIAEGLVDSNPQWIQLEKDYSLLTTYHQAPTTNDNNITAVIIHGMGCTSLEFHALARHLQPRLNLFRYDRVLFVHPGDSQKPSRDASTLAQELQSLLQARNISSPILLIGHSYGGLIAQWFAHLYTDQVRGLVLIDPAHELQFDTFPIDFALGFTHVVPYVFGMYQKLAWTGLLQWLDRCRLFNFPPIHLLGSRSSSPERMACAQLYSEGPVWKRAALELEGCLETFERMKNQEDTTTIGSSSIRSSFATTTPIALVIAGHRQYAPTLFPNKVTEAFLQMHQKSLPQAKVFRANQSDHWVHIQEPQVVLEAVEYVLKQLGY